MFYEMKGKKVTSKEHSVGYFLRNNLKKMLESRNAPMNIGYKEAFHNFTSECLVTRAIGLFLINISS